MPETPIYEDSYLRHSVHEIRPSYYVNRVQLNFANNFRFQLANKVLL